MASAAQAGGQADVVVYTSPLCGACDELKAYLRSKGVAFAVRDVLVDDAAAEELERRGIWSTPALVVGERFVEGFYPARVDALLGL